jgi:NAD(P)H-hydrate epimerase
METSTLEPIHTTHASPIPLYVLTAAEMQAVDERSLTSYGTPTDQLMESAGAGAAEVMLRRFGDLYGYRVAVVCGRGHNGGDGFVIARRLAERGARLEVAVLAPLAELEGVVALNLRRLKIAGVQPVEVLGDDEISSWLGGSRWDYVIDAMLGTGSRGELSGLYAAAAKAVDEAADTGATVVAVDLPTGMETDTGRIGSIAVSARLTVTFAYPKRGHVLYPGRAQCGAIEVIDIGIPPQAAEDEGCRLELFTAARATDLLPRRSDTAHKGLAGRGLLVGGSIGLSGAVVLAAEASLKSGLGMVFAAVPRSINAILETRLTEPITLPMPEGDDQGLLETAIPLLLEEAERVSAIAIGPGLGRGIGAPALVTGLLSRCGRPAVVDADGLNALAASPRWQEKLAAPLVITPHLGEMSRLTGWTGEEIESARIDTAIEWAARWNVTVLLKGAPTVIASPDGRATVNPSGNPGMASAGMGDVLTGCILGLLGQGLGPYDAACLGAYLHGRAADRITARRGAAVVLAGEVGDELPATLGEVAALRGEPPLVPPLPQRRTRPAAAEPPPDPGT